MARPRKPDGELDLDLEDLPAPARWREWMGRVEAVIFASAEPVLRENLARVVGKTCNLDLIIDDIRDELSGRPYEIVSVAGGWSFRTKLGFGDAIRTALGGAAKDGIVEIECACADGDRVFSADHPRGAVAVFGKGGFTRCDRRRCAARGSSPPGLAARRPARPTPMSPRRGSWRNSGSEVCATCRTSRSSRTRGCSGGRVRRFSTARRWRPS